MPACTASRVLACALASVLLLAGAPAAGLASESKPLPILDAVNAIRAATQDGNKDALRALAHRQRHTIWLTALILCSRGQYDAASALARAYEHDESKAVLSMVEAARERNGPPAGLLKLVQKADGVHVREPKRALALLAPALDPVPEGLVAVFLYEIQGNAQARAGRQDLAAEAFGRAAERAAAVGAGSLQGAHLDRVARSHFMGGNYGKAGAAMEERLAVETRRGDDAAVGQTLIRLGILDTARSRYREAEEHLRAAISKLERAGRTEDVGTAYLNLGNVYDKLGRIREAREFATKARGIGETHRLGRLFASATGNLAMLEAYIGHFAEAVRLNEEVIPVARAIRDRQLLSNTLINLASAHLAMRDNRRALALIREAHDHATALGWKNGIARAESYMGTIFSRLGEPEKADARFQRSIAMRKEMGNENNLVGALGQYTYHLNRHNRFEEALATTEEIERRLRNRAGGLSLAQLFVIRSAILFNARRFFEGRPVARQAIEASREQGNDQRLYESLALSMAIERKLGNHAAVIDAGREAIEIQRRTHANLDHEHAALVRGDEMRFYESGALAAHEIERVDDVVHFVESGKAMALLEALGGRAQLREQVIPEPLRRAEEAARVAELGARKRYEAARASRNLETVRAARKDLGEARAAWKEAMQRIEREARAGADMSYPRAATRKTLQRELGPRDAMVLYGIYAEDAIAVVLTRKQARSVRLAGRGEIEARLDALALDNADEDSGDALAALRTQLIEPLELPARVRRVYVSPDRGLAYVPFALLLPMREVVNVPSGSTHQLLAREKKHKGSGILAVGDPLYRGALPRLPGSREEAEAIGTVVRVGKDATEAGVVTALAKQKRWRAVHFACHGLVDEEDPTMSSLALTPTGDDDGHLRVAEIFQQPIHADLAVLSACESSRGALVRSEGVIGLVRAFMFAGAPRVLGSLWHVDDEATRALMVKFYALWKNGKGMPAATALRKAQAYVRGHAKWKHPYYWAAWVLWGLAE